MLAVKRATCEIINANSVLTADNFNIKTIAHAGNLSCYVVRECIRYVAKRMNQPGLCPWVLLEYFDAALEKEIDRRWKIMQRLGYGSSPEHFYYAVTSTIIRNSTYVTVRMKQYNGVFPRLSKCLGFGRYLLWTEFYRLPEHDVTPAKQRYLAFYQRYCHPLLTAVIVEWVVKYKLGPQFAGYYAVKLAKLARVWSVGEKQPNDLIEVFMEKPTAKNPFLSVIIDDEWSQLEGKNACGKVSKSKKSSKVRKNVL